MNERAFILILMLTLILGLGAGVLCSSIPNRGYLSFISLTIVKISLLLLLFSVGLRYGLNDLVNYGDPTHAWAMVMMSDGYHNWGTHPNNVLPAIKSQNISVYTIGLGPYVDKNLLKHIANETGGKYYYSPTSAQLQEIYNDIVGKLTDYGENERIYAVRFLMDKAYIVTFKETDPLFVVDLSNPENPEIKGELKISGYSSYLHPINKDLVLGIGKEDRNVKVSLFNVSDPENPIEVDRYLLKEYWSDILNTHHAFLIDKKHDIFFLPASNGGYVFSYKNSSLKLIKAVSVSALRAIYIDDYLYLSLIHI